MKPSLERTRLLKAKAAYTTRRADFADMWTLIAGDVQPKAGDLVLAKVMQVGHHKALELQHGRRASLFADDEILVCYADRYAPDQFEAEITQDLGLCDLVAAGGVAASTLSRHDKARAPTRLAPIGLVADAQGERLNLSRYALPPLRHAKSCHVLAVLGAAMNAGKTTTAVSLIRGVAAQGLKVGALKVTGTGAGGDIWLMSDAGAAPAFDFTAAGFASTYRIDMAAVVRIFQTLTSHAMRAGIDVLVIEVADGLYQRETAWLAHSPEFRALVDGVFFAAGDALGAAGGAEWLKQAGLPVVGLSGAFTQSPLAMREAGEATGLPIASPDQLADGAITRDLLNLLKSAKMPEVA